MKKYLIPAMIYGDYRPIIRTISKILLIGYFFLPHVGAQFSEGQIEAKLATIQYRLGRIEEKQKESDFGWEKVGTLCAVLALVGGLSTTYIRGQIRVSILELTNELAKDINDNFISEKTYDSGMKRILSEIESIKEEQRRLSNARNSR